MHDDFATLFAYNRWADLRMLDACRRLAPGQYDADPAPGCSSIRATLAHLAVVSEGWLRAVAGEGVVDVADPERLLTIDDAAAMLDRAHAVASAAIPGLTPERLAAPTTYRTRTRVATLPPWVVLRHVANHANYHRGQVASKLARFGVEPPITDFVFYAFEQMPEALQESWPTVSRP